MRYKIITKNKEGSFTIREEELTKLYNCLAEKRVTIFLEGWLDPSSFNSLIEDKNRIAEIVEHKRLGMDYQEPSPFAKFLSEKMKMLSDKSRTEIQEETAREERKK